MSQEEQDRKTSEYWREHWAQEERKAAERKHLEAVEDDRRRRAAFDNKQAQDFEDRAIDKIIKLRTQLGIPMDASTPGALMIETKLLSDVVRRGDYPDMVRKLEAELAEKNSKENAR